MARFNEILDGFGEATEGVYSLPESSIADLMGAYDEDTAGLVPASEVAALREVNAELTGQITVLKELNAMLFTNVGSETLTDTAGSDDPELDEDGDAPSTIDSLFTSEDN